MLKINISALVCRYIDFSIYVFLSIIPSEEQNKKLAFILSERRNFKRFTFRKIAYSGSL